MTATAPAARRRRSPMSVGAWPLLFVGPLLLGVLIFYYYPIIGNLVTSFTTTNAFGGDVEFVGLDNYTELLSRPDLPSALGNTLLYTAIVLLGVPLSVVIASMIELPGLKGKSLYRVLFFMPYLAMPVAIAQVWRIFFNGNFGLLNQALNARLLDARRRGLRHLVLDRVQRDHPVCGAEVDPAGAVRGRRGLVRGG